MQDDALTNEELQRAIDTCATEAIHVPGAIQPQGYMIILDDDLIIRKVSRNLPELMNKTADQLFGNPLTVLLERRYVEALAGMTSEGALNPLRSLSVSVDVEGELVGFDAIMHKSGDFRVLELELQSIDAKGFDKQDFYREIMSFSVQLQNVSSNALLYEYVVSQIQRITGFARVKLYVFDHEWNGKVVAEKKLPHMASYLGLTFPHSDIPKQARALYSKSYLRLIPDISYQPVDLIPDDKDGDGKPIDLSFSVLRSVSNVHLHYLQNMGIAASMSISIMQNDRLWGLIACHHDRPYQVAYSVRMLAELLGHSFSAFLSSVIEKDEISEKTNKKAIVRQLGSMLSTNRSLLSVLNSNHDLILSPVNADGAVFYYGGKFFTFGTAPKVEYCEKLISWLEENYEKQVFVSNSVTLDTGIDAEDQTVASGALVVPVSTKMKDHIMWFRKEQSKHVDWAGKPEKKISQTAAGLHLTPRASFNRWRESVAGNAEPWTDLDKRVGAEIGKLLIAKRFEDSVRSKTENLESILNYTSAVIYTIDTKNRIVNMNDAALSVFAVTQEAVVGKPLEEVFEGDFASLTKAQHKEVIESKRSTNYDHEILVRGEKRHFLSVNFPQLDEDNEVISVCAISTDITEIKQTEQSLLQSNKELERMAYIASHDLQEPLRAISSFTELIHSKYQDHWDEDAHQYIEFILNASKRMKNLISDLLYYTRISEKSGPPPLIDAQAEFDTLLNDLKMMYRDQEITVNLTTLFGRLYITPEHFNCVFLNLIGNCVKYAKEGVDPIIDIDVAEKNNFWVVSVKDNGIGIESKFHEKIFMMFQRLHKREEYGGTGIGLSLVQRIIRGYGGKVWLESELDSGSTFYFSLPKNPVT